jgi:hypothetical protein
MGTENPDIDNFIMKFNEEKKRKIETLETKDDDYESADTISISSEQIYDQDEANLYKQPYISSVNLNPNPIQDRFNKQDKFLEEVLKNPLVRNYQDFLNDCGLLDLEELICLGEKSFSSILIKRAQWDKNEAEFVARRVFSVVARINE